MNYTKELEFAKSLAREAGDIMVSNFGFATDVEWKGDNSPVTAADKAVNDLVIRRIKEVYPEDGVLGEEASHEHERKRRWIVDPIDGTNTYVIGAPLSTFCLALAVDNGLKLGVIYDPYAQRLFTAHMGRGAFLNEKPIHVNQSATLEKSYCFVSSRMRGSLTTGQAYDRLAQKGAKVFSIHSLAYACTLLASGAATVVVSAYGEPWDIAAAKVILDEAGAKITDFGGAEIVYDHLDQGMVVSNALVHDQVLSILQ